MKFKLFYKIFICFFVTSMVPMAAGGGYFLHKLADYQEQMIVELSRSRVKAAVQKLVDNISAIEKSLDFTARTIQRPEGSGKLLENSARQHEEILKEIVTDEDGRVLSSFLRYGFVARGTRVELPRFEAGEKRHVNFVSWNLEPQLALAYTLTSMHTGRRQGMLLAEISLKNLFAPLLTNNDQQINRYIVSSEGRIVSHGNINYVLEGRDVSAAPPVRSVMQGNTVCNGEYIDLEGNEVVGVAMRVENLPLYVVEETPVAVAYALSRALRGDLYRVCGFSGFFFLVAALLVAGSITRPIVDLERATALVSSGELDSRVELAHWFPDELDLFANHFNDMIAALQEDRKRRKDAEDALEAEQERLIVTLRSIADGVISTDLKGHVTLMNIAAEKMTGWLLSEALGRPISEVYKLIELESGECLDDSLAEVLEHGHYVRLDEDVVLVARDGRQLMVSSRGTPIRDRESNIVGIVLVFQDITARKKMETELLRAEKIRSVGVLAGGIAHDFNNQLTGVLGNVGLAKLSIVPESKAYSYLEAAERAVLRSKGLTQQLLTFAKGGSPVKQPGSIAALIRESSKFILRGSAVDCRLELAPDLWPLDFDEAQLDQVINNLLINAMQAMPDGGIITVKAENCRLDHEEAKAVNLPPGHYVKIVVQDQGVGMTRSQLKRIFDPYFTTKKQGCGLGLASCYSIIKKHDGHISVESQPDQGTTFIIHLPASARKLVAPEVVEPRKLVASGCRILVMDDEEMVRDVAGGLLEHLGFQASFAADGQEAVKLYQQAISSGAPFAAVIMDLTVPGAMGGKDCLKEVLRINPDAKVIVASGYAIDAIMADFRKYGFSGRVVKPFSMSDLSAVLEEVLGAR